MVDRDNYCKDCDRSIYGMYPSCDINIENGGKYVKGDSKCYCKIVNGERAEQYPWEEENRDKSIEDQWKREELKPCPWCENPVHIKHISPYGYYITCGKYFCTCPAIIIYSTEKKAQKEWNDGTTFKKVSGRFKED